ncbi:MAG: putative metallophosphoesterase [Syntrophorhabdaceae bacterium PtaU1.Bin034]|nr:MAG: putative metallophosphoesterase [Syntrophorhabdaceae bacterium PtaU1.Bin034]
MTLFLAGFFFVYSLVHLFVFLRARSALALGLGAALPLAFFMMTMIVTPIVIRLSEHAGWAPFARFMAYVGYTWMGLLFLFICALITTDVYRLVIYLVSSIAGRSLSLPAASAKSCFLFAIALVLVIGVYGWFEARSIRTEKVTVKTSRLPAHASPLRIVQISDVHLGLIVREDRLKRIMEHVKNAEPDVFVSTGDLVDGQMNDLTGLVQLFQSVNPRYGKFAITGNHEFYAGLSQALDFTKAAGFRVLRGEAVTVGDVINIVGVDDPSGPGYGSSSKGEKEVLSKVSKGKFTLFLKHRPVVDPESSGLFDLQLSGHAHNGQIFPFRLITRLFYPCVAGLFPLSPHSSLYVSRGTGTWGPPIRFLAPPEVTIIELVRP